MTRRHAGAQAPWLVYSLARMIPRDPPTPARESPLRHLLFLAALLAAPSGAIAQTSPFLPDELHRALVNEISGDRAFEQVRHLTHFHRTGPGRDFWKAAEYIRGAAEEAGLEDAVLVRQPWDGHPWSCRSGEAWLLGPEPVKLADYGEVAVSIADHSRTTHVEAPLVDVGAGTSAADYEGREVKGQVVLASGSPETVTAEAVWKRGALGIVSDVSHRHEELDAPDQVAWGHVPHASKGTDGVDDGTPGTFAVMVSPRRGRWLRKRLAAAGEPLRVRVDIEADSSGPREQGMVEAWIRGREVGDQQIVLTAHIQEEKTSANDDGSGCASMLEIGRALARLVRDGRLPRPRRDIRFWWLNELSSQPQYFRDHPDEPRRMLLSINQDMVGARQGWGGRVQYASRLPWSLPHPLEDVLESVLGAVRDGNTSYLSNRGTGQPQPFLREVTAVKGSREPFHARMVPYYDFTDHHAFTPRHVGVPATSLTNWPDEYIHSSGDDLENVDATQLERNALVVAAVALYFAALEEEGLPALAAHVAARGRARAAADAATAASHLAGADAAGREAALREARALVRESHRKEERALRALERLGMTTPVADAIRAGVQALQQALEHELAALDEAYGALFGAPLPAPGQGEDEREMSRRVYSPAPEPEDLDAALKKVDRPEGLHAMMAFETVNFADGTRTAWEVYEAVCAEALSAGTWYYSRVTPADVRAVLDSAVETGALTVKTAP